MLKVLIRYSEVALKGRNRNYFEEKVAENIRKSCQRSAVNLKKIRKEYKRLVCIFEDSQDKINHALRSVFGIQYFCYIEEINCDLKEIENFVKDFLASLQMKGYISIAFKTKRADKKFPVTSVKLNTRFGDFANLCHLKVDYSNAPITLFTEIMEEKAYFFSEKIQGLGGLPVSSGGRVLVLLSGGIDSPVAAWNMMKRGCSVDFLHVHTFRTNKEILSTKIFEIINILNQYQFKTKLYLIPYATYESFVSGKIPQKYDLVFFKHYLLTLADKIATEKVYDAISTGDNLGQVASQTIENMKASSLGIKMPIFMPLLTFDKQEIVKDAQKIGTYSISIKKYKDCCSLFAKHPSTRTKQDDFQEILLNVNRESLLEKSLGALEVFTIV